MIRFHVHWSRFNLLTVETQHPGFSFCITKQLSFYSQERIVQFCFIKLKEKILAYFNVIIYNYDNFHNSSGRLLLAVF